VLPTDFSNHASVTAHIAASGSDDALVSLTAKIDKRQLTQQLHFHREQEHWKIVEASLPGY